MIRNPEILSMPIAPRISLISATIDLSFLTEPLRHMLPDVHIALWPDEDVSQCDIAICWQPPAGLLAELPNLKLVHSIASGLDNIFADPSLPDVPVCRIVETGHALRMAEYALWATLLFHRKFDQCLQNSAGQIWDRVEQVLAKDYTVGILGYGSIGRIVGDRLKATGYDVRAWVRSPREEDAITLFAGRQALPEFLADCDCLICLLPLTGETRDILNADLFAALPEGAALINMGRGEHLVEADLLAACESGHLRGAVLDVFREEPLAPDHPFWTHPEIVVTPHIASTPDGGEVTRQIVENIMRVYRGEAPLNAGDHQLGY